ncbi:MAG: DUF559 domain-containing protein, partial [Pyrinomonadaceae bacterium]|nr:DUF559 domain-containing protein [Sphingobacteriaceae bacterium]
YEKLVIELDGSIHTNLGQANADNDRDEVLKNLGIRVLRVENKLVFDQPDLVLKSFHHTLAILPPPTPPKTGGEHRRCITTMIFY